MMLAANKQVRCKCGAGLGQCHSGDLTCCTKCGQWYETVPGLTYPVDRIWVGIKAQAKIDPYELLDAMEKNAREMCRP